jgi:hypothetical protein
MLPFSRMKKATLAGESLPGALGPTEEDREFQRRWEAVAEGLTDEQREHVERELTDPQVSGPGGRGASGPTGHVVMLLASDAPPVMHPEVARVYAEHPEAAPLHDCEDCGLGIPCRGGSKDAPFHRWFDACPNCGGRVGYYAYFHKHKAEVAAHAE